MKLIFLLSRGLQTCIGTYFRFRDISSKNNLKKYKIIHIVKMYTIRLYDNIKLKTILLIVLGTKRLLPICIDTLGRY